METDIIRPKEDFELTRFELVSFYCINWYFIINPETTGRHVTLSLKRFRCVAYKEFPKQVK